MSLIYLLYWYLHLDYYQGWNRGC